LLIKKYLKSIASSIVILLFIILSPPAIAANEALLELLKVLRDKGTLSPQEYELLVEASEEDNEKIKESINELKNEVSKTTKDVPKITTKGKFKVASQDGSWEWQPIGRIFWDTVFADRDNSNLEATNSELRRARLGFQGRIAPIKYKLELDFANSGTASWKDVWLSYNKKNDLGKWFIKVGQHRVPFGHATISSSKHKPLMRRPLFGDGPQTSRAVGIAYRQNANRWFFHTGAFVPALGTGSDETGEGTTDRMTYAFRIGGQPFFKDKTHLIHTAISYQHEEFNGDTFSNIDNSLLSHIGDGDALVANFGANTDDSNAYDIELISVWGPFHGVFEYVAWDVSDPDGDADLSAWAVDVGWFLTGESMKYKAGAFSGIKPKTPIGKGGWGAWQIAARLENMDLTDGNIIGGEADVFTVGLNWYLTSNTRLMANYGAVLDFNRNGFADDGKEPSVFQMRAQVYW
jgi:phosphate-selective porin OprO/OprP